MKATGQTRRFVLPTKPQTCGTALELRGPVLAALIVLSWLTMIPSVLRH